MNDQNANMVVVMPSASGILAMVPACASASAVAAKRLSEVQALALASVSAWRCLSGSALFEGGDIVPHFVVGSMIGTGRGIQLMLVVGCVGCRLRRQLVLWMVREVGSGWFCVGGLVDGRWKKKRPRMLSRPRSWLVRIVPAGFRALPGFPGGWFGRSG